jgi:hypothetical protein
MLHELVPCTADARIIPASDVEILRCLGDIAVDIGAGDKTNGVGLSITGDNIWTNVGRWWWLGLKNAQRIAQSEEREDSES